jgi:hypothetical protein
MKITINNSFERLVNAIATSPIVMNNKIQNVFQITERIKFDTLIEADNRKG